MRGFANSNSVTRRGCDYCCWAHNNDGVGRGCYEAIWLKKFCNQWSSLDLVGVITDHKIRSSCWLVGSDAKCLRLVFFVVQTLWMLYHGECNDDVLCLGCWTNYLEFAAAGRLVGGFPTYYLELPNQLAWSSRMAYLGRLGRFTWSHIHVHKYVLHSEL